MSTHGPAGLEWRRSSLCGGDGCVEAASYSDGQVAVRDAKDPAGPVLLYSRKEWLTFLAGVRNCEFDDLGAENL